MAAGELLVLERKAAGMKSAGSCSRTGRFLEKNPPGQLLGLNRWSGFGLNRWLFGRFLGWQERVGPAGGRVGLRENLDSLESKLSFSLCSLKSEFGFDLP